MIYPIIDNKTYERDRIEPSYSIEDQIGWAKQRIEVCKTQAPLAVTRYVKLVDLLEELQKRRVDEWPSR